MARGRQQIEQPPGYTSGWYDYKTGEVCLGYWVNDERHIDELPFNWYFYLTNESLDDARCRKFDSMVDDLQACKHGRHHRVYVPYNERNDIVDWLRSREIEPLEADVDPVTRYMSENPVRFSPPRILFYDLETDPRLGWVSDRKGGQRPHPDSRILSIAWRGLQAGSDGCEVLTGVNPDDVDKVRSTAARRAERTVLGAYLEAVSKHDLLVAWNGSRFDEIHLRERSKQVALTPQWDVVNFLDHLELFKHPYYGYGRDAEGSGIRISWKLEDVSRVMLGMGKVEDVAGGKMFDIWKKSSALVERYNRRDVDLLVGLEEKTRYIATHAVLANICNRFPSDRTVGSSNWLGDGLLLRWGSEHGMRFRTRNVTGVGEEKAKVKGAHNIEPVPGLHEGVCNLDVGSLYPNLVRSFNISPDTIIKEGADIGSGATAANDAVFRTDVVGAVPAILEITLANRQKYKDEMARLKKLGEEGSQEWKAAKSRSEGWKVMSNAFYGLLLAPISRIYDPRCGEAVTLSGQAVLKMAEQFAADVGIKVLAGSTDSVFLLCSMEIAEEFRGKLAEKVDEWVEGRGGRPGLIRLGEIDESDVYRRIFWSRKESGDRAAKNKYAGIKTNGKWDIRGLELVSSGGCRFTRELQRRVLGYVLEGERPTESEVEKIVRQWCDKLHNGTFPSADLAIFVTLGQSVDSYKVDNPQVKVARQMQKDGKEIYPGMRIPYVVVSEKKGKVEVVHYDDFDGRFDANLYWSKVYPPTRRVLDGVFPAGVKTWKALSKYNPSSDQGTLFDRMDREVVERAVFEFVPGDEKKFEEVRDILSCVVGETAVGLLLRTPTGDVVMQTGMGVAFGTELVRSVEQLVGHSVYEGESGTGSF